MRRMGVAMMTVGLSGLFACAPTPPPAPPPAPVVSAKPPPLPMPARPPKDHCGAWELQHLVGRPKTDIPVPVDPSKRRVVCNTCPVTMDYRQDRLNIVFDARTGIVTEVKCG
ncbi:MAG: peptidase inhibitor I78 [Caulobacter sp.]|nr:peptidase inhibitor I78 [Caulobacter sp.]